jgi:DNA polymerase-3 subunit gamma/tau
MTALRKNRVNHAYLFSGPRGCGKTTSARILARCLNCAQGPTDTPCGTCPSCIELARGGSGSLDVIEIDAASHGGVDDARDLRERATYAPVRDRYKIFIIDEAHMVTSAGFNALLKIVEEPPEHIKFIFATTEPDKVIGTIRSRTHHYPFRLVPPEPLMAYLELLCNQENVPVAPGVLSLVVRAGGGSVRDSLSVLDQLMAGAGPNGLDYELAVALLGYTHASLLDDVVEAIAASDAATVFRAVDRVIQTGHDPRRFVEDLLERFRDLIVVQAMPESAQVILRGMPADQIARLQNQAHNLGAAELSRAADVTNTALTEMTGATSPRLHLELLCARILLPSSEQTERGIAARIDRVERRLNYAGNDVGASAPAAPEAARQAAAVQPDAAVQQPAAEQAPAVLQPAAGRPATAPSAEPAAPQVSPRDETRPALTAPRVSTNDWPVDEPAGGRRSPAASGPVRAPAGEGRPEAEGQASSQARPVAEVPQAAQSAAPPSSTGAQAAGAPAAGLQGPSPAAAAAPVTAGPAAAGDVEVLRRAWPEVLQTLSKIKRSTWALVEPNAQVGAFDGQVLTLSFTTTGLAGAFGRADHAENLRQAIHKTIGIDCQITAVAGGASSPASSEPNPKAPASPETPASSADVAWGLAPAGTVSPPAAVAASPAAAPRTAEPAPPAAPHPAAVLHPAAVAAEHPGAPASALQNQAPEVEPAQDQASQERTPAEDPAPGRPESAAGNDGSYAYSDDDWGPPRDEDAPPLDEEPPMDWDPSAPTGPGRSTAKAKPSPQESSPPPAGKSAPRTVQRPARAGGPGSASGPVAPSQPDEAPDPWTRAVEQAPGIWVIGSETNVGKGIEASVTNQDFAPAAAPSYEPATAQVPETPRVNGLSEADASWGLLPSEAGLGEQAAGQVTGPVARQAAENAASDAVAAERSTFDGGQRQAAAPLRQVQETPGLQPSATQAGEPAATLPAATQPAVPEPAPVREYAMASALAPAPHLQPAPAASASAAAARQSLYQRLSNSPEAEAGRAKAPARAVAALVQDIPSADDETIEESGVFGRAAVERILGGKLIEERSTDGSPIVPRF